MRASSAVVLLLATYSVTASASDFVQTQCTVDPPGDVWLRLEAADRRIRTLSFSPSAGRVMFKGTTLSDFKWVANYKSFKEFSFLRSTAKSASGQLVLTSRDGSSKEVGTIELSCWLRIVEAVDNAVSTRIKDGA